MGTPQIPPRGLMPRAPFQVHGFPFRESALGGFEYAIF